MEIKDIFETIEVIKSDLGGSSFVGVRLGQARSEDAKLARLSIGNCNIAGLPVDDVLVSDALTAYRTTV